MRLPERGGKQHPGHPQVIRKSVKRGVARGTSTVNAHVLRGLGVLAQESGTQNVVPWGPHVGPVVVLGGQGWAHFLAQGTEALAQGLSPSVRSQQGPGQRLASPKGQLTDQQGN